MQVRIVLSMLLLALPVNAAVAEGLDMDRPMGEATARAMLGRFGYGATPASLAATLQESPRHYLQRAIHEDASLPAPVAAQISALPVAEPLEDVWSRLGPGAPSRMDSKDDPDARKVMQREEGDYSRSALQARLLTMANSRNPGHEALLSFWLNHFSIYAPKALDKLLAWDYARALDQAMAEDSFEALLRASFFHPAMQVYLDNTQSTAIDSPAARLARQHDKPAGINENLARELLELHTLGVDAGYSQKDVQELARIITGAGIYSPAMRTRALERAGATRQGLFLFDPRRHDAGEKTLLGTRFPAGEGLPEIERALHLLATQPATAHHIALKLARRFLSDDPPPETVDAMSKGFLRSGGRISATLMPLLASGAFAASLQKPGKFKEPLDYLLSVARAACGDEPVGNGVVLAATATDMGQAPFMHTTPDGYPTQESAWLSPATMARRVRLAIGTASERVPFAQGEEGVALRPRDMTDAGKEKPVRGTACHIDAAELERVVGPLSAATALAARGLSARERTALLLASPEFMRH